MLDRDRLAPGSKSRAARQLSGVELWMVDLASAASALEDIERAEVRLAPDDEERFSRRSDDTARREHRCAHIALRLLIERAFGSDWRRTPFERLPFGKPGIRGLPGAFSLSHSRGVGLIAIAECAPLGVDVECIRPHRITDDRRHAIESAACALAEGTALPEQPPEARFFQAWVRLEAVAKAEGSGIGPVLTRAGVGRKEGAPSKVAALVPLAVHDIALSDGLVGAIALAPGLDPPVLRRLPEDREGLEQVLVAADILNR